MAKGKKKLRETIEQAKAGLQARAIKRRAKEEEAAEAAEQQRSRCADEEKPRKTTEECLFCVTTAIKGHPIENLDKYAVDPKTWAEQVVNLADAWRVFPRQDITNRKFVSGRFKGYEDARTIWRCAYDGASVVEVAGLISDAREALGQARPADKSQDPRDSELGMVLFFREVERVFKVRLAEGKYSKESGAKTSLPVPSLDAQRSALIEVKAMAPDRDLWVQDVRRLYGLADTVEDQKFRKSRLYRQQRKRDPLRAWQLPFKATSIRDRRSLNGTLGEGLKWSPEEVEAALRGWEEHPDFDNERNADTG